MDRYEFREGSSAKFWEAGVDGSTLTVRYGKLGAQGQTKEKTFASPEAAQKEEAKLIKEKVSKGYVKTGGGDAPAAGAAAPDNGSAPEPALPDAGAASAGEEGRKVFDGRPLPTRMWPEPSAPSPDKAWTQLRRILQKAKVPFDETPPASVSADVIVEWLSKFYKAMSHDGYLRVAPPFVEWLAGSYGAFAAVQGIGEFHIGGKHYWDMVWRDPFSVALRRALTRAPETDYDEALAWCLAQCEDPADWRKAAYFAFVLADDRPASHPLQPLAALKRAKAQHVDIGSERRMLPLLVDAPPDEVAEWRTAQRPYYSDFFYSAVSPAEASATLLAVAGANGSPAAPSLMWLFDHADGREHGPIAEAMLETHEEGVLVKLLSFLNEEWVRKALDRASEVYPDFIFRECLAVSASGRTDPVIRVRLADLIARHGMEKARQWAEGLDVKALDRLEASFAVKLAPLETLPVMFRDPPWRRKKSKTSNDIVLSIEPLPAPFACSLTGKPWTPVYPWRAQWSLPLQDMSELPGFLDEAEREMEERHGLKAEPALTPGQSVEQALAWLAQRLAFLCEKASGGLSSYSALYYSLERLPEPLALMLWEQADLALKANCAHCVYWADTGPMMLARFGEKAVPGLLKLIEADPATALEFARFVDAPEIAPLAARAFVHPRLKKARALAAEWLRRYWRTALTRLIPDAVGAPGEARDAAESVLRWLVKEDPRAAGELPKVAAEYAKSEPRVTEAVGQVMGRDPLGEYPEKIAPLPSWVVPAALARPRLCDGGALPDEAVLALAEMLSFSTPNSVYAGVSLTRELCEPQSLGAFAWDLFNIWMAAGAPSKEGWALRAVGWIGDDECARKLTALIRKWPGESAHARAVVGLDVLADIGSDVALMNLNGIAEKLKFKGLQSKAKEKIAAIAEARELTPQELADRLAPDLDLDEKGGLDLDFGPRKFRVGFDEFLKPWVKDASDVRLKDLPKPNKSDDAGLGAAAVARWSALKKDARAVASQQLARLEAMLAASRRVRPDVFWTFFASHPLIRHLAQRLVWGRYGDDAAATKPSLIFRVSSDLECTDSEDNPVELDVLPEAEGLIGLVHPLHMTQAENEAWGALFGDYEIIQPFPQLGRETYALTGAEKQSAKSERFKGVKVEAARLRGMPSRGWELGAPQDAGGIWWIEREVRLAGGRTADASLSFHDGLCAGGASYEDEIQTLDELELTGKSREKLRFGELDDITASEMLRGLTLLAEAGKA